MAAQRAEQSTAAALAAFTGSDQQRVLLVRHGEALHNVRWREYSSTPDPQLTDRGRGQAQDLVGHPVSEIPIQSSYYYTAPALHKGSYKLRSARSNLLSRRR